MTDRQKIRLAAIAYDVVYNGWFIGFLYKEIYRRAMAEVGDTVVSDEVFDAVLRYTSCA